MCTGYQVCNINLVSIAAQKFLQVVMQHRTNAMDIFVFDPRSDKKEWSVVFGYNLRPQIWKKMPMRLANRLSAGFQAKESQPQVNKFCL